MVHARFGLLTIGSLLLLSACSGGEGSTPSTPQPSDQGVDMSPDLSSDMTSKDMGRGEDDMSPNVEQDMSSPDQGECDCPTVPAPSCFDGSTRQVYESAGCDATGRCLSDALTTRMERCELPPTAQCRDQSVVDYAQQGTCANGTCIYQEQVIACETPADSCDDARTLRRYLSSTCADGACEAESELVDCGDVGCCDGACCELVPSNRDDYGTFATTGIITGPPNGTFDTDTDCTADAILGQCQHEDSEDGMPACVCRADKLVINSLRITGLNALVILASDAIEVRGTLDVSAEGTAGGPGGTFVYNTPRVSSSAAGGSFGSKGGNSSIDMLGSASLVPLVGGCRGQGICSTSAANGGGPGGALQLSARNTITISGTLLANGGGGQGGSSGSSCNDGAGGGSGGGILVEAPQVEISGSVFANGGGGGGGGTSDYSGYSGQDGRSATTRANGGSSQSNSTCALYGSIYSGAGGVGASREGDASTGGGGDSETRCLNVNVYAGGGGGGGGMGYVRINTKKGAQSCLCGGTFSPAPSFGTLTYGR